jgi:hypothetical protein
MNATTSTTTPTKAGKVECRGFPRTCGARAGWRRPTCRATSSSCTAERRVDVMTTSPSTRFLPDAVADPDPTTARERRCLQR